MMIQILIDKLENDRVYVSSDLLALAWVRLALEENSNIGIKLLDKIAEVLVYSTIKEK